MAIQKSFICAALLCLLLSPAAQAADNQACKLTRVANLDMSLDRYGRPIIPVTINGAAKMALVDMGGAFSSMTDNAVRELNMKAVLFPMHNIVYIDGTSPTEMTYAEYFAAGKLNLATKGVYFAVNERPHGDDAFDATLSSDIMHLFDVELDFPSGKFQLFLQGNCGDRSVHWTNEPHAILPFETNQVDWYQTYQHILGPGSHTNAIQAPDWHMIARATLDDEIVDVVVETGAKTSSMTLEDAQDVIHSGSDMKNLNHVDDGSAPDHATYTYPFKTLKLGDITINNPQIKILTAKPDRVSTIGQIRPKLRLGAPALRQLHLYISYKAKTIYLTSTDTH